MTNSSRAVRATLIVAAALTGSAIVAQSPGGPVAAQTPSGLSAQTRSDLACAASFAIVATEQAHGGKALASYPPMAVRGREFFVRTGAHAMDEAGLTREAVKALLEAEVARLQGEAASHPDAVIARKMGECLPRLEATVPPLERPTLPQCAAIMQLAYDELHARDGLSAPARDLKTLAAVLESREREALAAQGKVQDAIDREIAAQRDAMLKQSLAAGPGVQKYDLSVCYELARPEEKSHY
ncbi:hypothetical protein ACFO0A_03425 [Novosphingobium tardum]|uniref:Uncharacterized protein n=1 Tax=Novosphingobium tardum TaxID=1538021 RepID=A0ABV8RLA5_9SPHN